MEQSTIGFVKWWSAEKPLNKLFVFLAVALIASVTINLKQAGANSALQQEKEKQIVECERRAGDIKDIASKALIIFMQKNDSVNREIIKENQILLMQRINKVTTLTENLKK